MSERWVLPPLWFDLCWEIGGFDEYPYPISVRSHGATLQERAVVKQRLLPELRAAGVLSGDTLTPGLARALAHIAKPGLWVEALWMSEDTGPAPTRLMSIAVDRGSVLLVQEAGESEENGGDLFISTHPDTAITAVAVQGMPPTPPGGRSPVGVPRSALTGRDEQGTEHGMLQSFGARPDRQQQATRVFRELVDGERLREGQLTANFRDHNGRQQRSPVFVWFDAAEPDGRYGLSEQQRPGIEPDLVVAPLGPDDVRAVLDHHVARVRSH